MNQQLQTAQQVKRKKPRPERNRHQDRLHHILQEVLNSGPDEDAVGNELAELDELNWREYGT